VMDEPTSSLTQVDTENLFRVISRLRERGVSVVYISHFLEECQRICQRFTVLRDGESVATGEMAGAKLSDIIRAMVGRELAEIYPRTPHQLGAPVLEVRNISADPKPRSVSFTLREGEILGIAGLVGAGRSEMAQAIFGTDPSAGGALKLDHQPLVIRNAEDAIRHGIYLIPEDRRNSGLVIEMTIRENITLPALGRYSSSGLIQRERERERAAEMSKRLNVKAPNVEERAGNLSGGNQQKVVLAKWLSLNPRVLIFDEPTSGIDVGAKAEIYALMRSLAREGVAIMMISSDMEEVLGVSDRVAVMHEGRLTGILDRKSCSEEAIMRLAVGHTDDRSEVRPV